MKNLVVVELEDGSESDTTCFGDTEVLVLDWDLMTEAEALDHMNTLRDLENPNEASRKLIEKLRDHAEDNEEDEEDEDDDDFEDDDDDDDDDDFDEDEDTEEDEVRIRESLAGI